MDGALVAPPGFKPVREALTLSWVGSIPTHLRHRLVFSSGRLAMFNRVAAWSVDGLGRSPQDLLTFLGETQTGH